LTWHKKVQEIHDINYQDHRYIKIVILNIKIKLNSYSFSSERKFAGMLCKRIFKAFIYVLNFKCKKRSGCTRMSETPVPALIEKVLQQQKNFYKN